MFFAFV